MATATLNKQNTALVEAGRIFGVYTTYGLFWYALKNSDCYDDLAGNYEELEAMIEDAANEIYGTKEDGSTYRIGGAPSRPHPITHKP